MYIEQKPNSKIKRHTNKATKKPREEHIVDSVQLRVCVCVRQKRMQKLTKKRQAHSQEKPKRKENVNVYISFQDLNWMLRYFSFGFASFSSLYFTRCFTYIFLNAQQEIFFSSWTNKKLKMNGTEAKVLDLIQLLLLSVCVSFISFLARFVSLHMTMALQQFYFSNCAHHRTFFFCTIHFAHIAHQRE